MDQTPEAVIKSAESWLSKPIDRDVESAVANATELVLNLTELMKDSAGPKQQLGALMGQVRSTQKAIENLEMRDWVEVAGGYLAIGHRPGAKLVKDLKLQNTTHILTLLSEGEQAKAIQSIASKNQLGWLWFPMESAQPPGEERFTELVRLFKEMTIVFENGGKIYLHCSAGIHRTGMISYAFLRYLGNDTKSALTLLKALRAKTSESVGEERVAWVDDVISDLRSYP